MRPYHQTATQTFYHGDVLTVLQTMPPDSVHCCVTSPPYWALRDYQTASWENGDSGCDHLKVSGGPRGAALEGGDQRGRSEYPYANTCGKCGARRIDQQLGLEPTPEAYITAMVAVFREVRRVLRPDATLWLNIGDSYAGSGADNGIKAKDLVGIPWMLAFALRADGWYLRSDIIWSKPNPMPESVTDRPTKAHEYLFLLTKSARYYYDADAIRETAEYGYRPTKGASIFSRVGVDAAHSHSTTSGGDPSTGRNKRSVWEIATEPYAAAHFATFPQALVEPCILAGTSERGVCPTCGAPWVRVVERTAMQIDMRIAGAMRAAGYLAAPATSTTTGWASTCTHDAEPEPGTVLDPFLGSGTTAWVATRLGRKAIGIDLNAEYLDLAVERNRQQGLL